LNRDKAARTAFEYLRISDRAHAVADLAIGFGHFDLAIARKCADLFREGRAGLVIFTGGRGSGTADIKGAEADAFLSELRRYAPEIPAGAIMTETKSTNTAENAYFSIDVLKASGRFDAGRPSSAILVASPYRERRVLLTCRKVMPGTALYCSPPGSTFDRERDLFAVKGEDLVELVAGELERIEQYQARDWIAVEPLPPSIRQCLEIIQKDRDQSGQTG
jgi:hypothetical protein